MNSATGILGDICAALNEFHVHDNPESQSNARRAVEGMLRIEAIMRSAGFSEHLDYSAGWSTNT